MHPAVNEDSARASRGKPAAPTVHRTSGEPGKVGVLKADSVLDLAAVRRHFRTLRIDLLPRITNFQKSPTPKWSKEVDSGFPLIAHDKDGEPVWEHAS